MKNAKLAVVQSDALVTRFRSKITTTSFIIAERTNNQHKNVMALIRKYENELSELGEVAFQTRLNTQGSATEYAVLTEEHTSLVLMLLKNNEVVVRFKLDITKAFFKMREELGRVKENKQNINWIEVRNDTKSGYNSMKVYLEEVRADLGKETEEHHHTNEARMINGLMTGVFSARTRDNLSKDELAEIVFMQQRNAKLIIQGLSYPERKDALRLMLTDLRLKRLS